MKKAFEDYFSELQADMVSICLEYTSDRADKIYIYCSHEGSSVFCNFFYRINGIMFRKHKLNDAILNSSNGFSYKITEERQDTALEIINEDIDKISELCKKYNRPMPTEMKLLYDVVKNSLVANYSYDLIYSNISGKAPDDVEKEWFAELKLKPE
jgi:hypothetical protein